MVDIKNMAKLNMVSIPKLEVPGSSQQGRGLDPSLTLEQEQWQELLYKAQQQQAFPVLYQRDDIER